MEQLERIRHMEQLMEQMEDSLSALREALEGYRAAEGAMDELEHYYSSECWQEDWEADEEGKLPGDLKRGVLSEDGLWNLLTERDSLRRQMHSLARLPENDPEETGEA